MTYRALIRIALAALVTFGIAAGCGRSDLVQYVWDSGTTDAKTDGGACGPDTCPQGCCDLAGTCRSGTELNACGFGGAACNDCPAQKFEFCDAQIKACINEQPTCDVTTCPSGCCTLFDGQLACVSGVSSLACGTAGSKCVDCTQSGEVCDGNAKACVNAPCGPNNCKGCCNGTTCVSAETDTQCGTGGLACTNCTSQNEFCDTSSGQCQSQPPKCGPNNCKGCCSGGVCKTSETDTLCGLGGLSCTDCTQNKETCSNGTCSTSCTPQTCPGCCQQGTCFAGFIDSRCGSGGASCADCTQNQTTCDTLATPRVCKSQQTTCPANYSSCPSSVATTVLSVTKGSCQSTDLADAKAACTLGYSSTACQSFFASEPQINPSCAKCLTPFAYDLQQGTGIFDCVSPFVNSTCNHDTGCISDCLNTSCDQCPPSSVTQCEQQVAQGQCQTYIQGATCIGNALFGAGSFCNPQQYQGNYGAWLAGVGAHYCQ